MMPFDVIAAGGRQRAYWGEEAGTDPTKLFDPHTSPRNRTDHPFFVPIVAKSYRWTLQIATPQQESKTWPEQVKQILTSCIVCYLVS